MSVLYVNPTGGNGTMSVALEGVKARHAGRVESLAFKHGRSGVGHIFYNPNRLAEDGNIRVWRKPSTGDPGQPQGWDALAPFVDGGLADHIRTLARNSEKASKSGEVMQALIFQSVAEGIAFRAEMMSEAIAAIGGAA